MKHSLAVSIFVALAALSQNGAGCGDPPIIRDPGFDLWCGETLCLWKVERGTIAKVGTWHASDPAVDFVDGDVAISQVSQTEAACMEFSFIADVAPAVELRFEADVYANGTTDYSERVIGTNWQRVVFNLNFSRADGIRFRFTKRGAGKATVAQLQARAVSNCDPALAADVGLAPVGTKCVRDADCQSSQCSGSLFGNGVCRECGPGGCQAPQVCGLIEPAVASAEEYGGCIAPGSSQLGDRCFEDAECHTGLCAGGRCSTCEIAGAGCANGEACSNGGATIVDPLPSRCSANAGQRAAGEPCFTNQDCQHGTCNGPVRKQCPDGRTCDSTFDCPATSDAAHGACLVVGITGGTCS